MKKALIYPYDEEFLPILQHWKDIEKIEIEKIISPRGWGYTGKSYHICNKNFTVVSNYETELEKVDIVWFVNAKIPLDFEKYMLPKIKQACKEKKSVFISRKLTEKERQLIGDLEKEIIFFPDTGIEINYAKFKEEIFNFNTPIIFILGLTEYAGKSFVQLDLWHELKSREYNIAFISTKKECQILGGYSIPDYMFSTEISEKEKILHFNHFVKSIEDQSKPELILINVPGETVPISREFVGNFGMTAYEISQAVRADCVIFNILYGKYSENELIGIGKSVAHRMGVDIDYYNIADRFLEVECTKNEGNYVTVQLAKEFVKENMIRSEKIQIYHLSEQQEIAKIADQIIDQLARNAIVQPI